VAEHDDLASQIAVLAQQLEAATRDLEGQRRELKRLALAHAVDAEQIDLLRGVNEAWNIPAITAHIRDAVATAPLLTDPFPHMVIEPLLPPDAFRALLAAVPAEEFFAGEKHPDLRGLGLSSTIVPLFSRIIWSSLRKDIVRRTLAPALAERFRAHAREFLRISVGDEFVDELMSLPLHPHGLRLMLRRPGWRLQPHLDPRDQFISTLVYLARPGDPQEYGTQLFRVHQENFVPAYANTYYPGEEGLHCELVKTMPFRGNLCVSMLNVGGGAHGAGIPADAQPADLRRVVFQFYIGPERESLEALVARLPPERQTAWTQRAGKRELRAKRQAVAVPTPAL
jgi:hypothetical protein